MFTTSNRWGVHPRRRRRSAGTNDPARSLVLALAAVCCLGLSTSNLSAVTFDWATIGHPGNPSDELGFPNYGVEIGAVPYIYRIGKYEVTNEQYVEFLNAVDATGTNPNEIYNSDMGSNRRGGISFDSGAAYGSKYSFQTDMHNKPVNYVSFFDTMRFVNWLENGQPTDGSGTESGVYTIGNGVNETRASGVRFFIPSGDEWHKAAYYDPRSETFGGPPGDDHYWRYPTSSDAEPIIATATSTGDIFNPGPNVVNYAFGADWNGQNGNVTTVGTAGTESQSFYGTFDQGGNVWEPTEGILVQDPSRRVRRGSSWNQYRDQMTASWLSGLNPAGDYASTGLRLASAEPSYYSWTDPGGGHFGMSSSWDPAGPPGPDDSAVFNVGNGVYTVTFNEPIIIGHNPKSQGLIVRNDDVTFVPSTNSNPPGFTYTVTGDTIVGELNGHTGRLTIEGFRLGFPAVATLSLRTTFVGFESGSAGEVVVDNHGVLETTAPLVAGHRGDGILTIQRGGSVSSGTGFVARWSGSTGTATVDGAGSTWANSSRLDVGYRGSGSLAISNGGEVSNSDGYVASFIGSAGTVTVAGAGSTWTNTGSLYVGGNEVENGGSGTLHVSSGAVVNVTDTVIVWQDDTVSLADGRIFASALELYGTLSGSGVVELGGGAFLNSGRVRPGASAGLLQLQNTVYNQSSAGGLSIDIGGPIPGVDHDQLAVTGTADLEALVEFTTTGSYDDPDARGVVDEFTFLTATTIDGYFDEVIYELVDLTALASVGVDGSFTAYVGLSSDGDDGMFRGLDYSGNEITLFNYLALGGDANGDMVVDGQDFIVWNANKFTAGTDWTTGDFTGDGITDGQDFIVWNSNKFTSVDYLSAVPEPGIGVFLIAALMGLGVFRRR